MRMTRLENRPHCACNSTEDGCGAEGNHSSATRTLVPSLNGTREGRRVARESSAERQDPRRGLFNATQEHSGHQASQAVDKKGAPETSSTPSSAHRPLCPVSDETAEGAEGAKTQHGYPNPFDGRKQPLLRPLARHTLGTGGLRGWRPRAISATYGPARTEGCCRW